MLQLKVQLNVTEEKSCQKIFSFNNCASKETLEESSSCPPLGVNFWAKYKTGCWQRSSPSLLSRWLCSLINIFLKSLNNHQSIVFLLLLFLIIINFRLFQMPNLAVCLFFVHFVHSQIVHRQAESIDLLHSTAEIHLSTCCCNTCGLRIQQFWANFAVCWCAFHLENFTCCGDTLSKCI